MTIRNLLRAAVAPCRLLRRRGWRRRIGLAALVGAGALLGLSWTPRTVQAAILPGDAAPTSRPLRPTCVVQTMNVFGLPWPAGRDVTSRCERLAACVHEQQPDFLALQEVWDESARRPLLVPGYHVAFSESPEGLLGQSGLMTLSLHPIVAATSRQFAGSAGIESWVRKGALRTCVALPDGDTLVIWNVHLQSGAAGAEVRREQIRELADWIGDDAVAARIVLGDFNCGPGDGEWELLQREFRALRLERLSGDEPTYDHRHNPLAAVEPPATIDHVFVDVTLRGHGPQARRIHDRPLAGGFVSDHFGVEVALAIAPRR